MAVRWILINENDEPVDPEHHLEEALKDAENLVTSLRTKIIEDPHSPFYGLSDEKKNELMAAIQKQDQPRSTIKGRALPSRKDLK